MRQTGASGWFFRFILVGTFLFVNQVFAEETPQEEVRPFRLGIGLGVPYGQVGLNLSYRMNDLIEASGGYGTAFNGFTGWAVGGRLYPFTGLKRLRPRLSAFYGVVQGITATDRNTGDLKTIALIKGIALGPGLEWKFFRHHSLDFDLFYTAGKAPEKYHLTDKKLIPSLGYGYHF
jgi:hypothetical protein